MGGNQPGRSHFLREQTMEERNYPAHETVDSEFVITRVFAAPREIVFAAFTESERMLRWWGPAGYTMVGATMDLRPGGSYHYGLRAPDGVTMWGKFVYREVVRPQQLVYLNSFSDAAGGLTRHPLRADWPLELLTTITLTEHVDGTMFTLRWAPLATATPNERQCFDESHESMRVGWGGTLDQLAAYLKTLAA
jgi:uncharacterized protein YndB with AHSA1/START domain